ncbi:MAG: UDP-N-acetylmuramoyl-L-alanine--D-glutamate ligase, partial [Betaproteobacteria bacterium]|nr:UDP-N-acetylmuramoyl-L-alanine--D-glutamate ligase [Betaproteobacteria bacterium]
GGEGKGQDFKPLAAAVKARARAVLLIGRDAPLIADALRATGVPLERCATLQAAVQRAAALAQPGEAVLLSPACASFDMFRDYAHRGQVYAQAVRDAVKGGAGG